MSAYAPAGIQQLWTRIASLMSRAQLSGIVGDSAHTYGYHCARHDLPSSDYSVRLPKDKLGSSSAASALDIKLPADLMHVVTQRLLDAAKAKDHRLAALREFCGTLDGRRTYPWDLSTNTSEGLGSWDDSHLWHIHLSFYREYSNNATILAPIADVLAGKSVKPATTYTVKAGDTLTSIAAHYKTSVTVLLHKNPAIHDANAIKLGQKITLP